jgi:surface antigen
MAGSHATKPFRLMNPSIFSCTLKCLVFLLLIAGCESTGPKAIIGGAGGAAAGGLLGAAFKGGPEGIAAGAILGGLLGGVVGDRLDAADRRLAAQTQQRVLETGRTSEVAQWRNPDNGHSGQITPTLTYQNATGQYCREFTHTIFIDGKAQKAHGSACREPDGTWRLVST